MRPNVKIFKVFEDCNHCVCMTASVFLCAMTYMVQIKTNPNTDDFNIVFHGCNVNMNIQSTL